MKRRTTLVVTAATVLAGVGGTVAVALPASAASAATVSVSNGTLFYRSAAADRNRLQVTRSETGFVLRELDVPTIVLDPAQRGTCHQLDDRAVFCSTRLRLNVELGAGNDVYDDWQGADLPAYVNGADGIDTIRGGGAADELQGGNGTDDIRSGHGSDIVGGGAGNDTLYGMAGNDWLDGQTGTDSVNGDDDNDTLTNAARDRDYLNGGTGNDVIESGDRTYGGAGDDTIRMLTPFGDLYGQQDFDTLDYTGGPFTGLTMSMDGNDNDTDDGFGRHNVHGDFEMIIGTSGDDTITGNNEPDIIEGRGGSDRLYGKGGNDVLNVQTGLGQFTDGGANWDACRGSGLTATACEGD